jgi:regulator of protease activity HflC (stomatin/prohibitin superfamily)
VKVFDPLSIVSKDGFEMTIAVKVIIRVLPEQAPQMVARIGSIENLIKNVIHPLIDSSFRNQASSVEAMKFMEDRHEMQAAAEKHVRDELAKYHVECVSVLICQIKLPEKLMETRTNSVLANQQQSMYVAQQAAAEKRKEMAKVQAQADQQPDLVRAEIGVQIAAQDKEKGIRLAEGKREQIRLEQEGQALGVKAMGEAEAAKIKAIGEAEGARVAAVGQATADAYQKQANAVGQQGLTAIEVIKQIAEGKIKITPDILVQAAGGDGSSGLMSAFVANILAAGGKFLPPTQTPPAPPTAEKTGDKPAEKK